ERRSAGQASRRCVQCDGWPAGPVLREIISWPSSAQTANRSRDRIRDRGSEDQGLRQAHAIALSTPGCSQLHHAAVFFPYKERSARGHKDVSETRDTARSRASRETPCLPLDVSRNGALEGAALRRH